MCVCVCVCVSVCIVMKSTPLPSKRSRRTWKPRCTTPVLSGMCCAAWSSGTLCHTMTWCQAGSPPCGKVPPTMLHAIGRFKGVLCETLLNAKAQGDAVTEGRCWKLLTFADRLLFFQGRSQSRSVGKKGGGGRLQRLVSERLRRAWRGDWAALWAEAKDAGRPSKRGVGRGSSLEDDARTINLFIQDGLLSKAIARARGALTLDFSCAAATSVAGLFPGGHPMTPVGGASGIDDELRGKLVAAAERSIRHFPRRSSPGPNGSRFEHWGCLAHDASALRVGAAVVVCFLLGEVPDEALRANLGARLVALRKPNGGVRPIAMGSTLRRLAVRAACLVVKEHVAGAVSTGWADGRAASWCTSVSQL